jgi:hypothetical protein
VKLRIGDTEYDYQTALNMVSLGVLMDLRSQGGPGRKSIALALDLIDAALPTDAAETIEDDERVLVGLAGLIFVTKRFAGESFTWEQACAYSWFDFGFVLEESDTKQPDPTTASGDQKQLGAETPNATRPKKRTAGTSTPKTSKPRSGVTSS